MIRKALSILMMAALCITLTGCDSSGGDGATEDAPKGGSKRPAPAEQREAPGPKGGAQPAEGEAPGGGGGGGE